jgi:hypothetical protein
MDPLQASDHVEISALLAAYADTVTRRAWPELAEMFEPDAPVRVDTVTAPARDLTGPGQLGEFIGAAVERFAFFELVVLNAHISVATGGDADRARARVLINEVRQDHEGEWSSTFGVYRDEYRRGPLGWRFARRDYQSLARTGQFPPFPFPTG